MIQNVLHHIGGVEMFGIISIVLFFTFFTGMLIWAFCLKKSHLNSMRALPLDGGERIPQTQSENSQNAKP